jgi:hypothetical protein
MTTNAGKCGPNPLPMLCFRDRKKALLISFLRIGNAKFRRFRLRHASRMTFLFVCRAVAGDVAAERLCGALFVGLTALKGYFYINLGGTQRCNFTTAH